MDAGIFVAHPDQYRGFHISDYSFSFGNAQNNRVQEAYDIINALLIKNDSTRFTYLYFGSEFCEYLIPSDEALNRFLEICQTDALRPAFVTPAATDYGIARLQKCLDFLDNQKTEYSVVVNDFGVLHMLSSRPQKISVIAGRLLDKTSHDPRIFWQDIPNYYGVDGIRYASTPGILSEQSRNILSLSGISRFEFDLPKTGLFIGQEIGCGLSLYWPFHYLTTGRVCLFRALGKKDRDKFLVSGDPCPGICKTMELELRKPLNGFSLEYGAKRDNTYLFQKGNTIFYLYENKDIDTLVSQFDRVIIQAL